MKSGWLDIVIPVYNEGANIQNVLNGIEANITAPHRILIVYDFDEDDTLPAVRDFAAGRRAPEILPVKNIYGRGALNAIRTGFARAEGEAVLVTMADCSDDLSIVDAMFQKIRDGYDVVCASRYVGGGRQLGGPRLKKLLSRVAGVSLAWLTGLPTHDPTNNFKIYRKSLLNSINIESHGGFEVALEITAKAYLNGYKITEIPTIWHDRTTGRSNFKLIRWLPHYLRWYLHATARRWLRSRKVTE